MDLGQTDGSHAARSHARACSLTRRLMGGAGSASVLMYRPQPAIALEFVAHGITAHGQFVIATCPNDQSPLARVDVSQPADVRVEILRETPDLELRVLASSVHMLGTLRWMNPVEADQMRRLGLLPATIADLFEGADVLVGIVETERVLLYADGGVTPIPYRTLLAEGIGFGASVFPRPEEELDCHTLVAGVSACLLSSVCRAVIDGRVPGAVCSRSPVVTNCEHLGHRMVCTDVDRLGMTLLHVNSEEAVTVFAEFEEPVTDLAHLRASVSRLVESSVSARQPRI
ncbi:MAG: hypothetical protein QM286_00845 [Acidobacteriota bacterium]|nr:hypothetical protein [Acidobacteriota bacterium]NLH69486.1 hypothetical protein [Brooklawnia sp.]